MSVRGHLNRQQISAFTLIEVLVVVAVVALLLAVLVPSLSRARHQAMSMTCLGHMHQLVLAAQSYTHHYQERYPIAYYYAAQESVNTSFAWDFTVVQNWGQGNTRVSPGLLWQGKTNPEVQQCPSFNGSTNWQGTPYTGYNYNTSYIGHGSGESIVEPARTGDVRNPAVCALFGDGEYSGGANKFMRAPWNNPGDAGFGGAFRYAGTQGYRHLAQTNVVFCDGHAESRRERFTETYPQARSKIVPGTGFLSKDNSLYDLK